MSEEEALKTIEELKNYISLEMIDNNKPKELTDLFAKSMVAFQVMENAYNKEKLNSLNLSEQLNKEKEKNKELENCLQMAKQIMTADISKDFDSMKLKEFKEYLLNEIKLNENFEE